MFRLSNPFHPGSYALQRVAQRQTLPARGPLASCSRSEASVPSISHRFAAGPVIGLCGHQRSRTPAATGSALNSSLSGAGDAGSLQSGNGISSSSNDGNNDKATGTNGTLEASHAESAATATASAAVAVNMAASAVVGAVAAVTPAPPPQTSMTQLLMRVVGLVRAHFAAMLLIYAAKDAAAFLVHRVTQRLTNHVAEVLLGTPTSTSGNPWWLYLDQAFIRAHPGYEVLVGLFFVACLPLTIGLNSIAFTAAALVCTPPDIRRELAARSAAASGTTLAALQSNNAASQRGRSGPGLPGVGSALHLPDDDPAAYALADLGIHALPTSAGPLSPPPRLPPEGPPPTAATVAATSAAAAVGSLADESVLGATAPDGPGGRQAPATESGGPLDTLRAAGQSIAAVIPDTARALRRVWWVDLQFNLRALPLQGLSLLVLPAVWTIPRLMRIQLALPAAVLERRVGTDALKRSSGLISQSLGAYGVPFAALLGLGRFLECVQGVVLSIIPPRWWREVVEVPLLIAGLFLLVKATVHRLQDLLPLAAYLELAEQEAEAARKLVQLQPEALVQPKGEKPYASKKQGDDVWETPASAPQAEPETLQGQ